MSKELSFIKVVQNRIASNFYTLNTVNQLISDRKNIKKYDIPYSTISKDLDVIYTSINDRDILLTIVTNGIELTPTVLKESEYGDHSAIVLLLKMDPKSTITITKDVIKTILTYKYI